MSSALAGKVMVITGGNGGIGLGIAAAAADAGASVMLWARNERKCEEAVAHLIDSGASAAWAACDVVDEDSVDQAMATTLARYDRVDGLVANAAIPGATTSLLEMPASEWRAVLDVNLTGAMLSFRAAARQIVRQQSPGALLAVSSIITRFGGPYKSHYAASKTAVHALVTSVAIELARHRIRCNSLAPGWTRTDLVDTGFDTAGREKFEQAVIARTPARRWGKPADYSAAVVNLLDPSQSFHTGDMITIDGGYTIF